jgi:pentatricopeptide repeat protein
VYSASVYADMLLLHSATPLLWLQIRDCNKLLRVLGDGGRLADAVKVFEMLVQAEIVPTLVTYSTIISR